MISMDNRIEFDIGTSSDLGTRFTQSADLAETLGQNFQVDAANPTSYKLKITIKWRSVLSYDE